MLLNKNLALGNVAACFVIDRTSNRFFSTPAHDISLLTNILPQIECGLPLLSKAELDPEI